MGWGEAELRVRPKGDQKKVTLALRLRLESLKWIAGHLQMGSWTNVSDLIRR